MFHLRLWAVALLPASVVLAADPGVSRAADLVKEKARLTTPQRCQEFRLLAAQMLQPENPEIAKTFLDGGAPGGEARPMEREKPAPPPPEVSALLKRMGTLRGLPTDEDRARVVLQIVADIRALPPSIPKLGPVSTLSNLVTEGDLGKEALNAVASTMAEALKETPGSASNYVNLARLVRYEHLTPLPSDATFDAANALLSLHDAIVQATPYSLTALDGRTYTPESLRGKVVLLNFWATWCPPCRREMPDLEKLYQRFAPQGLVVLAVSDEKRETVEGFLAKQHYTFPVLLDAGRKVNTAFGIEGIPNSFLFDREGKLVGQAIDMRTERQFLEMFQAAGLE